MIEKRILGFLAPPIDSALGFFKGIYRAMTSWYHGRSYFWGLFAKSQEGIINPEPENPERMLSATVTGSRTLGTAATVLCILGFIGALFIPIPGTAPLYAISVGAVFKAMGITLGWSAVGRWGGAILGGILDFFRLQKEKIKTTETDENGGQHTSTLSTTQLMQRIGSTAFSLGLLGESALIRAPLPKKPPTQSSIDALTSVDYIPRPQIINTEPLGFLPLLPQQPKPIAPQLNTDISTTSADYSQSFRSY